MKYKKRARPILVIAPGLIAGAEKVVQNGVIALNGIGLDPILIIIKETRVPHFADQFEKIIPPEIKRIVVDSTRAMDLMLPLRIREKLHHFLKNEKNSPVVFHSHGFKALIACFLIRGQNHHIHTHHGDTSHTFKVKMYEKIAMIIMKTCDRVIAVSQRMKEELLLKLHPYKNISVIDNMLSFKNTSRIRQRRLERQPPDGEVLQLLFVGRLSPEKGLIPFLECWSSVIYRDRFELLIIGDGPLKHQIEKTIIECHLHSKVKMLGYVDDPSEYFIQADLLIMPSLTEGLPMTLIESLASGVPVLANDVGAMASLVVHNHNGYLCHNSSQEEWATALWESLKNAEQWKLNAQTDAVRVEQRFSPSKWAVKTQAHYQV